MNKEVISGMNISITKYCRISNKRIIVNDERIFENAEAPDFNEFIRSAYKFAGMAYPKFYKMDKPCKLALVAAEILLKDSCIIDKYGKENIGVILQNASSTIDTDIEFQSTIDDRANYFPSPAVFVYTLPNIMIGEICIRHKIFGENALFIEREFSPVSICRHLNMLFEQKRIKAAIAGWIEQNGDDYEAFIYLAEISGEEITSPSLKHTAEDIGTKFMNNQ